MLVVMIVGFYFMLAPQHAYTNIGISLRNQTKFLIFMFALFGGSNAARFYVAITAGLTGAAIFALVFLVLDIVLINMYLKKL